MGRRSRRHHRVAHRTLGLGLAALVLLLVQAPVAGAQRSRSFSAPTYSSPIAMSRDGRLVWAVNPSGDSVSVISTRNNRVVRTIGVAWSKDRYLSASARSFRDFAIAQGASFLRPAKPSHLSERRAEQIKPARGAR